MRGEAQELGIFQQAPAAGAMIGNDDALHLIEEHLARHAAEHRERALEPQHHGERRLPRDDVNAEQPRVAEHHEEGIALAPGQLQLREITLRLQARRRLEAHDRLGLGAWSHFHHVVAQLCDAAGIPSRAALLK